MQKRERTIFLNNAEQNNFMQNAWNNLCKKQWTIFMRKQWIVLINVENRFEYTVNMMCREQILLM